MRITACYYLSFPDSSPPDPTLAATEMYVELGGEGDTIEHFQETYAFQVYTHRYVHEEFAIAGRALAGRSMMLVPTLADDWMGPFLQAHADLLPSWGEPK